MQKNHPEKHKSIKKDKKKPKRQEETKIIPQDFNFNQIQDIQAEKLQVSFIIGEIAEDHYHSLKTILLRYSKVCSTNNSQLADAIVLNKQLGNVSLADDSEGEQQQQSEELVDDQENVYSIITILSGKDKTCKKIKDAAYKKFASKNPSEKQTQELIKSQKTHLLVNQRLINLPGFVIIKYHEVFKKDLLELQKSQPQKYNEIVGGWILNISEIQFEGQQDLQEIIYSKFEDYQLCQSSHVWWIGGSNYTQKKGDMRNLYYLIKCKDYLAALERLDQYLQQ